MRITPCIFRNRRPMLDRPFNPWPSSSDDEDAQQRPALVLLTRGGFANGEAGRWSKGEEQMKSSCVTDSLRLLVHLLLCLACATTSTVAATADTSDAGASRGPPTLAVVMTSTVDDPDGFFTKRPDLAPPIGENELLSEIARAAITKEL